MGRSLGPIARLTLIGALGAGASVAPQAGDMARASANPAESAAPNAEARYVRNAGVLPAAAAALTAQVARVTPDDLPRWKGGVNLYRPGVFSTQKTWSWCTAAGIQIMRNIVFHRTDHARSSQQRYFSYMRDHLRYPIPVADGVDPAGWAAGLRRWVDPRYRVVAKRSFRGALRSAVTRLRKTNLPVSIAVARGNHAWVLTGFTATADPAMTPRFKVTSVRVSGPLWGRQNAAFGYDMRPDARLTTGQLKRFFTAWHYPRIRMAWEGRWVSIQPVVR
jgi:hypothetical protein